MWYTILITLVVDLGGLLLVYVLLRDRVRRATTSEAQIAEIREEVSRLLVELNQATDRNIALMEDKIASLNEALSTADKKIGLLRREIEKHDVGSQIYSRLAEGRPMRTPTGARPQPGDSERGISGAGERPGQGFAEPNASSAPGGGARHSTQPVPVPPLAVELSEKVHGERRTMGPGETREPEKAPDSRERVIMLHRAGFSPSLIAGRVGVPLGEVELIISLEQRKGQA